MCLKECPGIDSCDYINASFIDVRINNKHTESCRVCHSFIQGYGERKNAYIAAQGNGPLTIYTL